MLQQPAAGRRITMLKRYAMDSKCGDDLMSRNGAKANMVANVPNAWLS